MIISAIRHPLRISLLYLLAVPVISAQTQETDPDAVLNVTKPEPQYIIDALCTEWDRLQALCTGVHEQTGQPQSTIADVKQEQAALKTRIEQLSADKADLEAQLDALGATHKQMQATQQSLEEKLAAAAVQLDQTQTVRTRLEARIGELEQQNESISKEKSLLQTQLGTSEAELVKMGQAVAVAQGKVTELQGALEVSHQEQAEMADKLKQVAKVEELEGALEVSRREKAALADQLKKLEGELESVRREVVNLADGLESGDAQESIQASPVGDNQRTYIVQEGDTLSSIAIQFYGNPDDWRKILRANGKALKGPTDLRLGMSLIIP